MKSALFVDFDNVFSGLRRLDSSFAERFASQPQKWVEWLSEALPAPPQVHDDTARRLLVRRCYLNPQVYQRFRPAFNRAGFEIVDCPAMTSEGKTSTDIHMVLDIVDLLQHVVHYDEFIVFSADADFTPVLRKLRRWDRRTTVLAIGFPSAAYQASADLLIDQDDFVRVGLGLGEADEAPLIEVVARHVSPARPSEVPSDPPGAVGEFDKVRQLIVDEVARARGAVPCARLAQLIAARYAAIAVEWGGRGTFRKLLEALDVSPMRVDWSDGGHVVDPRLPHLPSAASGNGARADWERDADLLPLMSQVHDAANVPLLSPKDFGFLLGSIVADLALHPFVLADTGKRVRDRCREASCAISRQDVNFVLKGILIGGHTFGQGSDRADTLGLTFVSSVLDLCRREQLMLDDAQTTQIKSWAQRSIDRSVAQTSVSALPTPTS